MISTYKSKKFTWVNLESPTTDEVKTTMQKYGVHPLVAEEMLKPTIRPKAENYENFIYLILHFPVFDSDRNGCVSYEIDFVVGKNFLITTHYKNLPHFYEINKIFEVNAALKNELVAKNPGIMACIIISQLYKFALRQLDHIQEKIDNIENRLFKGEEYKMVEAISYVHRDLLDFRKAVYLHNGMLTSFSEIGERFFGKEFVHRADGAIGELTNLLNIVSGSQDTIVSLQSTNDSLLSNNANETMKTLNILAFLTFPLMLFAALFSMDTVHTPIVGMTGDFWIVVGIMAISVATMIQIFKRKGWLK